MSLTNTKIIGFFFLASLALVLSNCKENSGEQKKQTIIAFGSCSHQNDSLQMWHEIRLEKPDLFILTGDNIYGDTDDMAKMKAQYDIQKNNPSYTKLIKEIPVIGIWDDHDYGINDGGKNYSKKDESKELLLDFLDVPQDNPVRNHKGAYNAYDYYNGKLKVILLDTRYFRDTLQADTLTSAKYLPNETGDILGKEQWSWLKEQLTDSKAEIHLIISSIQLISAEHDFEKWANFPQARKHFFDLLTDTNPKNVIIISGDRHMAELSKMSVPHLDYPLYEITSSGFTHTWSEPWPENNRYRVDSIIIKKNYGLMQIDWSKVSPEITIEIKGHGDSTFLKKSLTL